MSLDSVRSDPIDMALLARYFAGECTATESGHVEAWIAEVPGRAAEVTATRGLWDMAAEPAERWEPQAVWERVSAEMPQRERGSKPHAEPGRRHNVTTGRMLPRLVLPQRIGYIAAGFAAAIITIVGLRQLPEFLQRTPAPTATKEYRTAAGQRARIRLPDGSAVLLAPATAVSYSSSFGQDNRVIQLDGEAVFTVTHASGAPFIVRARQTEVRVLGTTFGVRGYAADRTVRVAVAEGKVSVGNAVLSIGDVSHISAAGASRIEHDVNVTRMLSWTEGRLIFENTPLSEVVPDLERWYGVTITLANPALAARRVSGGLVDQPVDEALRLLAQTVGASTKRSGMQVTFTLR